MSVALRLVDEHDCERVYRYNASPAVRAVSRDPRPIAYADHCAWFARRLAAVGHPFWIVVAGGLPLGVVRIDRHRDGDASISIALADEARGRGLGRQAIALACATWAAPLRAEILHTNSASRTCFEACGFHATSEHDGVVTYAWRPSSKGD